MSIKAVIFDLDGVIVSTDDYHYQAWKQLADQKHIDFNKTINNHLRGVSRAESLEILLEKSNRTYTAEEKHALTDQKNSYYVASLSNLSSADILPGVIETLNQLKQRNIKVAIGSSSKNTPLILAQIGLQNSFDAISDGNNITKSKPDPEVFLYAANKLAIPPQECVVIEDAEAGIAAALAADMKAVGVGSAANSPKAHYTLPDLAHLDLDHLLGL